MLLRMKKEWILSFVISSLFLWNGFIMLHNGWIAYGVSFFIILPILLGYIFSSPTNRKEKLNGVSVAIFLFLLILFIVKLEGLLCIIMALPLVLISYLIGGLFSNVKKVKKKNKEHLENLENDDQEDLIKRSILPFCLFLLLGISEGAAINKTKTVNEVSTEIILPYNSKQVYETIKSVDTLDVPKPFLMKLDLPIPLKCILEEEKVGGLRRCYFEGGEILEKVTKLEKGKVLQMDVIDYQLTGRKWLGFKEANYLFEDLNDSTSKMTRITTYTSELYPRFYWKPLESLGISQEHDYVFRNLEKDLRNKYNAQ